MKIMIVNDPTRKNDDPTYLLEKFDILTSNDLNVVILSLEQHDTISDDVEVNFRGEFENFTVKRVSEDFHNFKEYAQTCDYLLIMPNALIDGITGALINAFTRYNSVDNIFTF